MKAQFLPYIFIYRAISANEVLQNYNLDTNEAPTDLSFEPTGVNVEYLVVGGGGGGGGGDVGAGGGAGGFRTNKTGSQSGGGCAAEHLW